MIPTRWDHIYEAWDAPGIWAGISRGTGNRTAVPGGRVFGQAAGGSALPATALPREAPSHLRERSIPRLTRLHQPKDLSTGGHPPGSFLREDHCAVYENVQLTGPAPPNLGRNLELMFQLLLEAHGLSLDVTSEETALDLDVHCHCASRGAMDQSWQKVEHRVSDSLRTSHCLCAPQRRTGRRASCRWLRGPAMQNATRRPRSTGSIWG